MHIGSGLGLGMLSGGSDVSAETWMAHRDKQWDMEVCERGHSDSEVEKHGLCWGEARRG